MPSKLIRPWLIATISLSLSSCAISPIRDDSPESDLDALMVTVQIETEARKLPNGKTYCLEDAMSEGARDECALDLEEALWLSNEDKARLKHFLEKSVKTLKLRRQPCGFFKRVFRPSACRV